MSEELGDKFQNASNYHRGRLTGASLDFSKKPELYKIYPDSKKVELPPPKLAEGLSFTEVVKRRRSIRRFTEKPVDKALLSYLLWASTGIQRQERGFEYRSVPSAGALYPIETYLIVNNVADLKNGLYHYFVKSHVLEELKLGDFSHEVTAAALDQRMFLDAAVVFIWTAIFNRSKWKYRQRAYRYIYLDAGHVAQSLALSAVNVGLGTCQVGAFYDDEVNRLLDVDGIEESTIYLSVVGYP